MEADALLLSLSVIAFFLLSVGLEWLYGRIRRRNTYRLNDMLSSIFAGELFLFSKLLFLGINASVLTFLEGKLALWSIDSNSIGVWIFAFIAYDFCYYWTHRISHERQIFWASHVVHHQSEYFNLSTALRQPATGIIVSWLSFLPLILLGIPAKMYITVAGLNLIYQFWVHTEHIPKLGWYEKIFVTPSAHRVHHGQNDIYIDRNYGGVFIIWDRMFGSFQEELDEEPVIYGVREPIRTFNPLWDNAHIYLRMSQDVWRTAEWKNKFRILFSRTGWRPMDTAKKWPRFKSNLERFKKYDPSIPSLISFYAFAQFLLLILSVIELPALFTEHGYGEGAFVAALLSLTVFCTASWLNGQKPFLLECARLCLFFSYAYFAWQSGYKPVLYSGVLVYGLLNLLLLPLLYYLQKFPKSLAFLPLKAKAAK